MALLRTKHALGVYPMPTASDSNAMAIRMEYSISAVLALNDVIYMGDLPANHLPVDFLLDSDDVSAGADVVMAVGIINATDNGLSTAAADGGAAWLSGSNIGQAGGMARPTTNVMSRVTNTETARRIGVHISTAATTTTTGKVGLTLIYRAASYGK
jgi:hypothetical protein